MRIFKQVSILFFLLNIFLFPNFYSYQEIIDVALEQLTDQINQFMEEQNKTKIAIIPFSDLHVQATTVLGSYIAEELTTNLFMTRKFKIVERNLLKQVIEELKLGQTGVVDPNSAKELGKMAGVDAIVTGTIADLGSYLAVNCRLIDTETGEVFAAAKAKIRKDVNIENIMKKTIESPKSGESKERTIEEHLGIPEGNYDVRAKEISIRNKFAFTSPIYFGVAKVLIRNDDLVIKFYAHFRVSRNVISPDFNFQLEEAHIFNTETLEKRGLKRVEGLNSGRARQDDRVTDIYEKKVKQNSRIWGSLYFHRLELTSPKFLLYINGFETEIELILQEK